MEEELHAICAELAAVVERLDDLSLTALREAANEGAVRAPEIDRRLVRARRALERAIQILSVAI